MNTNKILPEGETPPTRFSLVRPLFSLIALLFACALQTHAQVTVIPQTNWALWYVDSQDTDIDNNAGTSAFDGNPNTFWNSQWYAAKPTLPHEIQINLGGVYNLSGFRYLARQDGRPNGRIGQYEFYVSSDGTNWGSPVVTGTLANVTTEQQVTFPARVGQYVRLRALSDLSGSNYRTSMAELNLLQTGAPINLGPDGVIDTPTGNVSFARGSSVNFTGTASDPDGNTPLTYRWNFGAGSGVPDSTQKDPGFIQFNTAGTYTVSFTVTDANGLADATPAKRTVTAQATAPTLVPQTNWGLLYVDSQDTDIDNNAGTSAFDGNPNTFWNSQWYAAKPNLPHEIQINLGGVYNLCAFRYLARQDGRPNGRIGQYEFYISSDGVNWGSPVVSGTLANVATEQQINFSERTGQYVRLRALSDLSGSTYRTSMAELNLLQLGAASNLGPNGVIDTPAGNVTITPGGSVNFTGTGSDPDNNTPLTYRWRFGTGSGIPDSTQPNPGSVQFNSAGTYIVSFTVTDALGLADATPATRTIVVQTPSLSVIPRTGWALSYVDSQENSSILTAGTNGVGAKAFDGNPNTMWHTDIDNSHPAPPHMIILDLGSVRNVCGFRYLPRQDANEKGRIGDFELLVSVDGNWGAPVAKGRFPNSEAEQQVLFTPKMGRFVKLRAINDVNGALFTAIAELNFIEASNAVNAAPDSAIISPAADAVIPVGGSIEFSGSVSDADGPLPLSYRWSFGAESGVPDSTLATPGFIRFEKAGTYSVTLTAADAYGLVDPTPATRTIIVQSGGLVPRTSWSLRYVDSQETVAGNYAASRAFDGNINTIWHTEYSSVSPTTPHEIQIDLGSALAINGFTYLPRQDGQSLGRIGRYEFYVSTDGVNWGDPVTEGAFPNNPQKKQGFFVTAQARFVRLRALTEVNGQPYIAVAELEVLAAAPVVPSVVLLTPRTYFFQTSPHLYVLTDANLAAGQGVRFILDGGIASGGAQTDIYNVPYEAMFTNLASREHTVEARVINAAAAFVSGAATQDRAEQVGIGEYYVAMGDSITYGIGDGVVNDNASLDGRNATAGFTPILQDLLTVFKGHPVAVFNEGLPGEDTESGVARIQALLQKHSDVQRFLILYGTNDAGASRPSGLGLNPGNPGYAGSFKHNMQQIIDAINAAGKQPLLAKIPPFFPINGAYNQRVLQYNQVISALAAVPANNIALQPPDFYAYFASREATHFIPDKIHPNGLGYQAMANLWFDVLTP